MLGELEILSLIKTKLPLSHLDRKSGLPNTWHVGILNMHEILPCMQEVF